MTDEQLMQMIDVFIEAHGSSASTHERREALRVARSLLDSLPETEAVEAGARYGLHAWKGETLPPPPWA